MWQLNSDNLAATCVATLEEHKGKWYNSDHSVSSVAFHPTAPILATGSYDETVKLWRLNSDNSAATCVATLRGHYCNVLTVAFHPTAPILASGSENRFFKLWRLNSDNSAAVGVLTVDTHSSGIYSVAFHPIQPILATGGCDRTAKLWRLNSDCSDATCVATLELTDVMAKQTDQKNHNNYIDVAFHPTAPILATGSEQPFLWG